MFLNLYRRNNHIQFNITKYLQSHRERWLNTPNDLEDKLYFFAVRYLRYFFVKIT